MWWLLPIAWVRWSLAALLVITVVAVQLREPSTVAHPFAAETLEPGAQIGAASLEWRDVPAGLLPEVELTGVARTEIARGSPITPDRLTRTSPIPDDWWIIELPVGRTATVGTAIRIVVLDPVTTVTGVLAAFPEPDPFGAALLGAVAIPPDAAELVARAAVTDALVTLVGN